MKPILDIPRTAMEVFNMLPEGMRCEVIDNMLYMSLSPNTDHQDIAGDIFFFHKQSVTQTQSGKAQISPLAVYPDNGSTIVRPDFCKGRKFAPGTEKEDSWRSRSGT